MAGTVAVSHILLWLNCLLLLSQPVSADTNEEFPSYSVLIEKAGTFIKDARSGYTNSSIVWLKKEWPILFSRSLFERELIKIVEHLAQPGNRENITAVNVSSQCIPNLIQLVEGIMARQKWAVHAIDSMGRPPPDLQHYNLNWPGSLKECQNVKANSLLNSSSLLFSGKYCTAQMTLAEPSAALPFGLKLATGICVPDSCSGMDVTVLLDILAIELKLKLPERPKALCKEPDDDHLDHLAISALVVAGVFVLLMVLGTLVDVYFEHFPMWRGTTTLLSNNLPQDDFHVSDDAMLLGTVLPKKPEPGFGAKVLMAFSVYTNGAKMLSMEQTAGTLQCVHGLRFFSMTWVVLGHTFLIPFPLGENLFVYLGEALKRWTFQGIINATVSVDSFFVLSGLLVAYLSLKEMKRTAGRINWLKFYFHRFWRLTPPYMLIIFMYLSLGGYFGSGPLWVKNQGDRVNCQTSWWSNMLYINNFVYLDKQCLGQSWYLANDMQFYLLSPLIFVPLYYSPLWGSIPALVLMLATTITPGVLTMVDHLGPGSAARVDAKNLGVVSFDVYYIKPYNRMGPYIMGMLTGYLLYVTDCKVRLNKALNLVCWAISTAVALAVLYGLYHSSQGYPMSLNVSALYNAMARPAWGACVSWVIFACVTGNGGFVNTILSWKALIPLSRLTYCIYLLHIMILSSYVYSRDTAFYYTDANVVALFLGLLVACYMISAVVSLAFEAPMMALEKLVFRYPKKD